MEPKFKTSFIPKKTLAKGVPGGKRAKGSAAGFFMLTTGILAALTVLLAVGVFLYQQYLIGSIERKSETLERARAAFEPALIQELVRLDKRIDVGQTLLENHIAPSAFFSALEEETLPSVRYTRLSLTESSDGQFILAMQGEARNFNSVALQADAFGRTRVVKDPIFSGLNIDEIGRVVFELDAYLDKRQIRYVDTPASSGGAIDSL